VQVYRVSQSGQESEETHLSDTLVNYSNDAQVNVCRFVSGLFSLHTIGGDGTVKYSLQ